MFKNLRLKSKLLVSFFIITCISSIATTVFSIFFFSAKIEAEAVGNMKKNIQVAELIYQNKLNELSSSVNTIAGDATLQLLVSFNLKNKIEQFLNSSLQHEPSHHIIVLDAHKQVLGEASTGIFSLLKGKEDFSNNMLVRQALAQNASVASTEQITTDSNHHLLAITAASPIFKSKAIKSVHNTENMDNENISPEVVGVVITRYILNTDTELTEGIHRLLGVRTLIYQDGKPITFRDNTDAPEIKSESYEKLMHTVSQLEEVNIRVGGQLAQYKTLYDIDKKAVGVLSVSVPADKYVDTTDQAVLNLLGIMLACILVASILGYLLAQSILVPIDKLLDGVRRVTSGDLSYEIIMDLKDELGMLARSFNSMAKQLQELFNTLEQRVQNATRNLQNTLAHMTAIIDNMADGLLVSDTRGKIIRFNPALLAMFPEHRDALSKTESDIFSPALGELEAQVKNSIGTIYDAELQLSNNNIGKAVATAIILKDAVSEEDSQYLGSRCIGTVILIRDITREKEIDQMLKNTVDTLTRVGIALSSENNVQKLLDLFVSEARNVSHADGATLYIVNNNALKFEIVQNKSLNLFLGGNYPFEEEMPDIPLDSDRFAARCAQSKQMLRDKTVRIVEYRPDCLFNHYEVHEALAIPMLDRSKNLLGVLQLINPLDPKTSEYSTFNNYQIEILSSLASQAAVAIENVRNHEKIERKNEAFKRFVPTEFIRHLGKTEVEDIRLGDASHESMSVLFSDIRSFTTIAESMSPEETFIFLNDYLRLIGPNITQNRGFIDKYIGDAIMALFPGNHLSSSADDAVAAAVGMMQKLQEFNLSPNRIIDHPISIGVGIHTGALTLGTIGFESRMESTVIGDTVNLASRVESLTKMYGITIGITSKTLQQLTHPEQFLVREVDTVQVKGKEEAITVYEVFNADVEPIRDIKLRSLNSYHEALSLYKTAHWDAAMMIFNELSQQAPQDKLLSTYLQRCSIYKASPPEENWRGITRLDEK
ncbi:MAG: adenylate/guanylate cyclase domain-containing protein [Thiotrichaceae bacterium]|nr:adenylate/guanylate cyclase domain-containing protein [Thiotrichaceae bacterium]